MTNSIFMCAVAEFRDWNWNSGLRNQRIEIYRKCVGKCRKKEVQIDMARSNPLLMLNHKVNIEK